MRALIAAWCVAYTFSALADVVTVVPSGTGSGHVTGTIQGGTQTVIDCAVTPASGCTADVATGLSVEMTAAANEGSVFKGWNTTCAWTGTCKFTVNGAKTVGVRFEPAQYPLSVTVAGSGAGRVTATGSAGGALECTAGSCTTPAANGETVVLVVAPDPDSLFTGWSGTACRGTTNPCTVTMDAAKSVTANFQPSLHLLTVNFAGAGTGTVTGGGLGECATWSTVGCRANVPYGRSVTLTATADSSIDFPETSSVFKGWEGAVGCGTAPTCTVTMNQARAPLARFEPATFPITVEIGGTAWGRVQTKVGPPFSCERPPGSHPAVATTCTFRAPNGSKLTLGASRDAGSSFRGWAVVCTGTADCTFTANAAKRVTAQFNLNPAAPSRCAGVVCSNLNRCQTASVCDLASGLCSTGVPLDLR